MTENEADRSPEVHWYVAVDALPNQVEVQVLAQDPQTGEVLASGALQTLAHHGGGRAVQDLRERLEAWTVSPRRPTGLVGGRRDRASSTPPARWTPQEDARLLAARSEGELIEQIAAWHGRSVGAIRARLAKLDFEADNVSSE